MKFYNLNQKLENVSKKENLNMGKKRSNKNRTLKLVMFLIILSALIYLPSRGVYSAVKKAKLAVSNLNEAAKNNNFDAVNRSLTLLKSSISQMDFSFKFLVWVKVIPWIGGFYTDAAKFTVAINLEIDAGQVLFQTLEPYKEELGFNNTPSPGQDRISQAVKILDRVLPNIDQVKPFLDKAADEVKNIDIDKYPETLGSRPLKSKIETIKNFITGASFVVSNAQDALKITPSALGEPNAKNYLVIFQNDKELRATGGFMTAYAFIKLDKGRVSSTSSDDIYRLDEKLLKVCLHVICPLTPPAPLVKYLPEANGKPRTAWSIRDSNLSPDLPTSMRDFEKMYGFLGEGVDFDGIIVIDTKVVEELIKITGPIEVYGTRYSGDLDKRCNCPNVIYELENYSQIVEKGEQDRKAILGTLMQQILARSLGASTDKLPDFINAGVKLAQTKDVLFYMHDSQVQRALSRLNWTGEIKSYSGDYLNINDSNFAGGKSNLYVTQDVNLDITPSGSDIKHKLTITYKNPQPYNGWLNAINRSYVRFYVPKGSKLISSKGSDDGVSTIDEELGKTVFEAFIQVRPESSRILNLEYSSPRIEFNKEYPILIQKQPGKGVFRYTLKVDGKHKVIELDKDSELKFSL